MRRSSPSRSTVRFSAPLPALGCASTAMGPAAAAKSSARPNGSRSPAKAIVSFGAKALPGAALKVKPVTVETRAKAWARASSGDGRCSSARRVLSKNGPGGISATRLPGEAGSLRSSAKPSTTISAPCARSSVTSLASVARGHGQGPRRSMLSRSMSTTRTAKPACGRGSTYGLGAAR